MNRSLVLMGLVCLCACGAQEATGEWDVEGSDAWMDHDRWELVGADEDPFTDRPEHVECPRNGWRVESYDKTGDVFEVSTGICGYITARQPTGHALSAGDEVTMRLWHLTLTAPEPAQAHAAVTLDGEQLFEAHIGIPNAGGFHEYVWTATRDVPAGAELVFHLHNHGANSWRLLQMEVSR